MSAVDPGKLGEGALLKEICAAATHKLETMDFPEFVHTINMVFPYMHREQIALWNTARYQMQNTNPWFNSEFRAEMTESREQGVFHRTCEVVK